MADFGSSSPSLTTAYTTVLQNLRDRDTDLALMFDGTTSTNIPTGAIKWDGTSKKLQKYNGTSWDDQVISVAGGGTGAADAASARTNLGLGTISTQNANAVAITGGSITDISTFSARASGFTLKDNADATKVMKFNLAGMTSGVTRTLVPPNADTTLVGTDTAQTLTNKTLTDAIVGTQAVGDNSTKAASTAFVHQAIPSGVIMVWPSNTAPAGYLFCYGQAISRSTYAALFAVIGTSFGSGDGTTTFNVPDLRGLLIFGNQSMGGSNRGVLDGTVSHSTLGATFGSQYHNHGISIGGSTAGSLSISISNVNTTTHIGDTANVGGGGTNVPSTNHWHQFSGTFFTSGSLTVAGSGSSDTRSHLNPMIVMNYVIKV